MPPYELLIVDDIPDQRNSLRDVFESVDDFRVIGLAADGQEALTLITEHPPDLVLMDLDMPIMDGAEATMQINRMSPQTKVIIQTVFNTDPRLFQAICSGAWGYVAGEASRAELLDVVRRVGQNYTVYGPEIARQVLKFFEQLAKQPFPRSTISELTPRENEILHHLIQGKAPSVIAVELTISKYTVRHHTESIYRKLNVNNRIQAMMFALQQEAGTPNIMGRCPTCPFGPSV